MWLFAQSWQYRDRCNLEVRTVAYSYRILQGFFIVHSKSQSQSLFIGTIWPRAQCTTILQKIFSYIKFAISLFLTFIAC